MDPKISIRFPIRFLSFYCSKYEKRMKNSRNYKGICICTYIYLYKFLKSPYVFHICYNRSSKNVFENVWRFWDPYVFRICYYISTRIVFGCVLADACTRNCNFKLVYQQKQQIRMTKWIRIFIESSSNYYFSLCIMCSPTGCRCLWCMDRLKKIFMIRCWSSFVNSISAPNGRLSNQSTFGCAYCNSY